jgi:hypothetical protein
VQRAAAAVAALGSGCQGSYVFLRVVCREFLGLRVVEPTSPLLSLAPPSWREPSKAAPSQARGGADLGTQHVNHLRALSLAQCTCVLHPLQSLLIPR